MQSVWDQGRNECDDQDRNECDDQDRNECDDQGRESSRVRERERETERGSERSFIAPGAGGANEPHIRSSEEARDQLLGHVRS